MEIKLFRKKNIPVYHTINLASSKSKISIHVFLLCSNCIAFEQLKERKQCFVKKLFLILVVPEDQTDGNV